MAKKSVRPARPPKAHASSFTDTRRVQELISLMTENGLSEIELVEDKSRILLRRGSGGAVGAPVQAPVAPLHPPHLPHAAHGSAAPGAAPSPDAGLVPIKSPMVGTFYSAPNPDSEPYVTIGTAIDEKTTVCIIEAMKHYNEIPAETRGTIVKFLVSNGQVVEFGQPLFLVKPD